MIYYAKGACMIDGVAYNGGEIVPEAVVKTSGSMVMHLLRKEGEPLEVVRAAVSTDTEGGNATDVDDEDDDLPPPEQKSDDSSSTKDAKTTPIDETGSQSTTAPATTVAPAKDAKEKKETK